MCFGINKCGYIAITAYVDDYLTRVQLYNKDKLMMGNFKPAVISVFEGFYRQV